ncbi:MAG TPA: hypothetical protein PLV42_03900 [bacterium]|nr:hypothetical protein [bacterium]
MRLFFVLLFFLGITISCSGTKTVSTNDTDTGANDISGDADAANDVLLTDDPVTDDIAADGTQSDDPVADKAEVDQSVADDQNIDESVTDEMTPDDDVVDEPLTDESSDAADDPTDDQTDTVSDNDDIVDTAETDLVVTDDATIDVENDVDTLICEINVTKCGGDYIMTCNGAGWDAGANCADTNQICDDADGTADCKTPPEPECVDGAMECLDDRYVRWCDGGLWFSVKDCQTETKICVMEGEKAVCKGVADPICGNDTVEAGELCDGGQIDCVDIDNYAEGVALCNDDCDGWVTATCGRTARYLTLSGTVTLYHPTNVPGSGDISGQLSFPTCTPQPVAGAASPYGSLTVAMDQVQVFADTDNAPYYMTHFFTGDFGQTEYGSIDGAALVYYDEYNGSWYYNIQESNYDGASNLLNSFIMFSLDDGYEGVVNLATTDAHASLWVMEYDLTTGQIECAHAFAAGSLTVDTEVIDLCLEGEKRCREDVLETCGAEGIFVTMQNCAASGKTCRDDACVTDPNASRFDFSGPVYSGDTLLVVNVDTDGGMTTSTGTLPLTLPIDSRSMSVPTPSRLFVDGKVPVPGDLDRTKILRPGIKPLPYPTAAPIGTVANFWVYDFGTSQNREASATLQYNGTKCEVWAEDTATLTQARAKTICDEFDAVIHPLVTTNFHAESDINGDGKIAILFADLGGFAAGYFTQGDYYDQSEYEYSNERDMVYLEIAQADADSLSTIAHEFQHLCYSNRNYLIEGDYYSGDLANRWIDEGLATAAQHLYEGAQDTWVYVYNNDPYNQPVAAGNGFLLWDYDDHNRVYSDYALTYVFFQYLRRQATNATGIYKAIIEHADNNWMGVEDIIQSRVGATKTFTSFMIEFRLAMLMNDATGTYGFNGESGMEFYPRYYSGTGMNLEGGGALYLTIPGSFTEPVDKGANIRYVGIDTQ